MGAGWTKPMAPRSTLKGVELVEVPEGEKQVLANLWQLYEYDSSEYNHEEIDSDGQFPLTAYFDAYWTEEARHPFFILCDGLLVGFALARELEVGKHSVAEFFVARKHRRSGIGRRAAFALFDRFPGEWHVAQDDGNHPAQRFWLQVIGEYTHGEFVRTVSPAQPKGPKQVFRSRGS